MNEIKRKIAPYYRQKFVTTSVLEEDIKLMKKLNTLFCKLEKSDKEVYVQEIINLVKILNNTFQIEEILVVLYECVDLKYHKTLDYIIQEVTENKRWLS
jgi:hypothetical protein